MNVNMVHSETQHRLALRRYIRSQGWTVSPLWAGLSLYVAIKYKYNTFFINNFRYLINMIYFYSSD